MSGFKARGHSHAQWPTAYNLPQLRRGLSALGFRLHYFCRLRSTSDHAAVMRRAGKLLVPSVVLTAHQTAGRGRGTNTWFSTSGVITVTFALPTDETATPHHLPLLAGLAVRNACAELAEEPAIGLKWPNDLYHDGRKLGGLLCERIDGVDLIGLGLNVNLEAAEVPAHLRPSVTSLSAIRSAPLDLTTCLLSVARHLSLMIARRQDTPPPVLLREYEQHHILTGKRVAVCTTPDQPPLTGTCQGIDPTGRLLLLTPAGPQALISGHVQLL